MKNWGDVITHSVKDDQRNLFVLDDCCQRSLPGQHVVREAVHALPKKSYFIGAPYDKIYFTHREAECLFYLLRGLTISATAKMLHLSPRTVEFYVKNMKIKLKVKTKSELVECLHALNFMRKLM